MEELFSLAEKVLEGEESLGELLFSHREILH